MSVNSSDEEIFDVVDQNDNVIGQRSRAEVHRLGLLHRSTHLLVFNDAGQIFIQKRSLQKDCNPGLWDSSVAGHVDSGETYDACVLREAREEIGLHLNMVPQFLFKLPASIETGWEFSHIYKTVANGPFILAQDEIETAEWFDTKTVEDWMTQQPDDFASTLLLIWRYLGDDISSKD